MRRQSNFRQSGARPRKALSTLPAPQKDEGGFSAVFTGLALTSLIGAAGLATDVAYWQVQKRAIQGAADEAAYSAAQAGTAITTQAQAIAAQHGFVNGSGGVSVAVNQPPSQGNYTGDDDAIEVIITAPQPLFLSKLFLSSVNVSARSVAASNGGVCMLTTDTNSGDIHSFFGGTNGAVTIHNCAIANNLLNSSDTDSIDVKSGAVITIDKLTIRVASICDSGNCQGTLNVANPVQYNQPATADPYAGRTVPAPSGCGGGTNTVIATSQTLSPGTYCGTNGNAALTVTGVLDLTATAASKSGNTLTFASTTGVAVGMTVADTNTAAAISSGTTVTAVSGTTVTLSSAVAGSGVAKNDTIVFNAVVQSASSATKSGSSLPLGSATGVTAGMTVSDLTTSNAISSGTTVTAVSGSTVTISAAVANTVNKNDVLQFVTPPTVTLSPGTYVLDGQGGGTCSGTAKPSTCLSGNFDVENGATVTGTGVSIVLTTSQSTGIDVGNVYIDDSSALSITAPTSGSTSGIAIWQDPCTSCTTTTPRRALFGRLGNRMHADRRLGDSVRAERPVYLRKLLHL